MIRGCPIFSASRWWIGWFGEDNLRNANVLSGCSAVASSTALQPNKYSQHHTLTQCSHRPRAVCNLLISNGTTDHSQTLVANSPDRNEVERCIPHRSKEEHLYRWNLVQYNVVFSLNVVQPQLRRPSYTYKSWGSQTSTGLKLVELELRYKPTQFASGLTGTQATCGAP